MGRPEIVVNDSARSFGRSATASAAFGVIAPLILPPVTGQTTGQSTGQRAKGTGQRGLKGRGKRAKAFAFTLALFLLPFASLCPLPFALCPSVSAQGILRWGGDAEGVSPFVEADPSD